MDVNSTNITQFNHKNDIEDDFNQLFLMGSPLPLLAIMVSYWAFVLKIGPAVMKNRPAFQMNNILGAYNLIQVFISFALCYHGTNFLWNNGILQTECVMERDDAKMKAIYATYGYFLAKITELLDTVFFILRKKYTQASFLHIYHHSVTAICTWIVLKYETNVNALIFLGTLNSYVHVIMYTYYGLSAYPSLTKYLWWKKYITKLQLVQFVLILCQILTEYKVSKCKPSNVLVSVVCLNLLLFVYLFTDFYHKTYKQKNNDSSTMTKKMQKLN